MSSGNKILTVTYGAFSCTLEGFDADAFSTMKAITEYFRDLTAEDRQFGASASLPDPGKLKRIAEQEMKRRVDASVDAAGVVLKPAQGRPGDGARVVSSRAPEPAPLKPKPRAEAQEPAAPPAAKPAANPATNPAVARAKPASSGPAMVLGGATAPQVEPGHSPAESLDGLRRTAAGVIDPNAAKKFRQKVPPKPTIEPGESVADKLARVRSAAARSPADPVASAAPPAAVPPSARVTTRPLPRDSGLGLSEDEVSDAPGEDLEGQATEAVAAGKQDEDRPRGGRKLADEPGPGEDDLDRLVETTNSRLDGAESRRKVSAIAHLKAAVAATVADRKMGQDDGGGDAAEAAMDRYRDDLSRAVQARGGASQAPEPPGRPASAPPRSNDPPPLVLVSSQRIHEPDHAGAFGAGSMPDRVSTIAMEDEALSAEDRFGVDGEPTRKPQLPFPEFAALSEIEDLTDLMEAAAAYLSLQEGRDQFSRPLIMKMVAQIVPEDELPREEGLRSFGALLRQGRIEKTRRGQFTLAKASRYGSAGSLR